MSDSRRTAVADDKRLEEIASIVPIVDEEAPEITPEQAEKTRLAHVSHPMWFNLPKKTGETPAESKDENIR